MTYDGYEHHADHDEVANARRAARSRRDSDHAVAVGWLAAAVLYLIAAWCLIDGALMPWLASRS